jgi:DNA invertase Pin-like site-specific DNA recombinase
MMNERLRFAPLVRVSTERQKKRGESLALQKSNIEAAVKEMGGTIVSWDYSGQEHSTPESERKILDQLLEDAAKNKFDAIIIKQKSRSNSAEVLESRDLCSESGQGLSL